VPACDQMAQRTPVGSCWVQIGLVMCCSAGASWSSLRRMRVRPGCGREETMGRRRCGQVRRPQYLLPAAAAPTRFYHITPHPPPYHVHFPFTRCRHPTATMTLRLRSGWPATRVGCASANATRRCRSAHSAPSKLKLARWRDGPAPAGAGLTA
jgi:hypothetical protein